MPSKSHGDAGTVDDLRHIALFARMTEAELERTQFELETTQQAQACPLRQACGQGSA